jgi:hypothetical protein
MEHQSEKSKIRGTGVRVFQMELMAVFSSFAGKLVVDIG